MIYVPVNEINDFSCYTVYDDSTIRAYVDSIHLGNNSYTDFYIKSHYLSKEGVQNISSSVEFPQCINSQYLTNDYFYRFDISHILVIVLFFCLLIFFLFKIFSRLFGRWLHI